MHENNNKKQNQDKHNLRFTITQFTFNKKQQKIPKIQTIHNKNRIISPPKSNNQLKSKINLNKIYNQRKNSGLNTKEQKDHIIFTGEKGLADHKNNMFLTWRERHNKLITSNNRDVIIQDIIKKIKSTQIRSEPKFSPISYQDESTIKPKLKGRWYSSKDVQTPIELMSRKLDCERVKSHSQSKKFFQIKNIQRPILLSKFLQGSKQKSCILRISGWEANECGFEQYNI